RAAVPTPNQAEVDRENIAISYEVSPEFSVGVGRQNFVQDSSDSEVPIRATGNTVFAAGRWRDIRLSAGLYDSRSQGTANLSSYFALGRQLAQWLDAEIFVLQSRPESQPVVTTPLANLRWRLSPRVGLSQQISFHDHRPTILFGASLITSIGEFGIDYQIVHQPFKPLNPFRSALNLTARLQLGRYSTSLGTYVRPDGAVDYSASGSTFLYMGSFGGAQPQQVGGRMSQYVIRGKVRDTAGNPVEGAALDFSGELVFTNSSGEFLLRVRRPSRYALTILPAEFLLPGVWEVLSAPDEVTASAEARAVPLEIILRHPETSP
ncbi:MAG TPA: carboxypeptidase-like regulatory domain-containing protein, partial [Gemmatimonadales bacterium]|nr:carboxypeptidase-like regulatory domain-containing protein [Gemmatimonadales bacterium]